MKPEALEADDGFALLGPGFTGGRWRLLRGLRAVRAGEAPAEALGFCRAETAGRDALWLTGAGDDVELELTPASPRPSSDGEPEARAPGHDAATSPEPADHPARAAPAFDVSLDDAGFLDGVAAIRERIAAGDVYQVNLTVRASVRCASAAALLRHLCRRGVPRFAAWVKAQLVGEVVSASPELLFELDGRRLRAEPMKGTAPAGQRAWLEASAKDVAELAMITDLLRDDLNRLCEPRSVEVPCPRRYLELPYAVQAVSDVVGTLRDGAGVREALAQLHPGGSVTGAPRPAALAVIAELERSPRGAYCGTLVHARGDTARAALLIRTAERSGAQTWRYGVGGGITWDSDPHAELDEVRVKLGALR